MAKEYNELEQLVNDVTNIDTARMTLRWALERLNAIEKEKADLNKNLNMTEEARKGLEIKIQSLESSFQSRGKTLDEKEGFYNKLEATMSLLGEGKLDIQQLLKKEAKLDQLRKELENEYQNKFEDLDKNQNSVIERWNQRLLDVEGQYAKRLSEAQNKYDSLRGELEADYQKRLGSLDAVYQSKEKELVERIKLLESSVRSGEGKLEGRRKELESEFIAKKNEIEENYLKLKSMLETTLNERVSSIDGDHAAQLKSLEKTWNTERARLLEEQRIRDEQSEKAQAEIARLEAELSARQEKHHSELMEIINRKEEGFRNEVAELEKEKTAYEAAVKKLTAQLERRESEWLAEKERLNNEFARRAAEMDSSVRDRAAVLEKEYACRKEDLQNTLSAAKEELERTVSDRLEAERRTMAEEAARLEEAGRLKDSALEKAHGFIKELESVIAASREEHHRELMEKIRAGEEAFRQKLAQFEAEKDKYKAAIAALSEELAAKDKALITEKEKISGEFFEKYDKLMAEAGEKEAAFESDRTVYEERIGKLQSASAAKERRWALEKEKLQNEFAAVSSNIHAVVEERIAVIKADYEARQTALEQRAAEAAEARDRNMAQVRAVLEQELSDKLQIEQSAIEAERRKINEEKALKEKQFIAAGERIRSLEDELAGAQAAHQAALAQRMSEKDAAYRVKLEALEGEKAAYQDQLKGMVAAFSVKEQSWLIEREELNNRLVSASSDIQILAEERIAAVKAGFETRSAELERELEARVEFEKKSAQDTVQAAMQQIRIKEEQLAQADARVKESEDKLIQLQDSYHAEILSKLKEKEEAFRASEAAFEKEKEIYAAEADQARRACEAERKGRQEEAARANMEIARNAVEMDKTLRTMTARFEGEYAVRAAQLRAEFEEKGRKRDEENEMLVKEVRAALEKEFSGRLALEKAAFDGALSAVNEEKALREKQLVTISEQAKTLEARMAAMQEIHHTEIIAKIHEQEEAFRAKAEFFEKEKEEYNGRIKEMLSAFSAKEQSWLLEKERLNDQLVNASAGIQAATEERVAKIKKDSEDRLAALEKHLAAEKKRAEEAFRSREAAFEKEKESYEAERKGWQEEKTRMNMEFSRRGVEMGNALKDRTAELEREYSIRAEQMRADFEEKDRRRDAESRELVKEVRAVLEKEFSGHLALEKSTFDSELAKISKEKALKEKQFLSASEQAKALEAQITAMQEAHHAEILEQIREKEESFQARILDFEKEKDAYNGRIQAMQEAFSAKEQAWLLEREEFSNKLADASAVIQAAAEERISGMKKNAGERLAEMERRFVMEKERAEEIFRSRAAAFDREKAAYEDERKKWQEEKELLRDDFAGRCAALEASLKDRAGGLEAEYASKKEALIAELASKEKAMAGEAAARTNIERAVWEAERARTGELLAKTAGDFKRAQDEIEALTEKNTQLGVQLMEQNAAFNKNLMELRAGYEKEMRLRLTDAVELHTGPLKQALDASEKKAEEVLDIIRLKDSEIKRLKAEMAERAGEYEVKIASAESAAVLEKMAELEAAHAERQKRLEAGAADLRKKLEKDYQDRYEKLASDVEARSRQAASESEALALVIENTRKEAADAHAKVNDLFGELTAANRNHEEAMLRLKEEYAAERGAGIAAAVKKETVQLNGKIAFLEAEIKRAGQYAEDEIRMIREDEQKEKERILAELERREKYVEVANGKLKEMESELLKYRQAAAEKDALAAMIENTRKESADAHAKVNALFDELTAANRSHEEAMLRLKEEYAAERGAGIAAAVEKETALLRNKIGFLEAELIKSRQYAGEELLMTTDGLRKEKERVLAELERREAYIEVADHKLEEMESELLKYRQNAAAAALVQITDQDDKFKAVVRDFEARQEKLEKEASERVESVKRDSARRLAEMDEMLKSREKLAKESEEMWRRKQMELDARQSEINANMRRFSEEIVLQKQELSDKSRDLNERQLDFEKESSVRSAEIEKLRIELTRAIMDYKNRK